jgi:hypothetical protein
MGTPVESGVSYSHPSYPGSGYRPLPNLTPLLPVSPNPVPGTQPVIPAPVVATPPPRVYFTREAVDTTKMVTLKQISDDGAGGFATLDGGTINYTTGAVHFKPVDTYVYRTYHGSRNPDGSGEIGNWTEATDTDAWADGSLIRVWFRPDSVTPTARSENLTAQRIVINLNPYSGDAVMPGSVMFKIGAAVFVDRLGILYRDPSVTTGSGIAAGTIDYAAGIATVTDWAEGDATFELLSLLTVRGNWDDTGAEFRTPAAPIKPEALSITAVAIDGTQISGAADANGDITGALVRGAIDYEVGTAWLEFGAMGNDPDYVGDPPIPQVWLPRAVDPASIRYNAVAYSYLPLDAGIIGIDPVRLPPDGRVPIFRAGQVAIIMHTDTTAPATIANGGSIDCGRTRLAWVRVLDAAGDTISTGYTLDRATGIVTVPDITGMAMPISVQHTVADLRLLTDVQINGDIKLARPLSHAFPANETLISSCLVHGDRRARVSGVWDQASWDSTWTDAAVGPQATATLDTIAHPIVVTNEGAETERWLLRWTSTTNVELIGQTRGLVYSGPYTNDIAPINPRTREPDGSGGVPYLSIPLAANGGGWSAGNVVRINTVGAIADIWIARSIQQSDEPLDDGADGCEIYALGNIDRP